MRAGAIGNAVAAQVPRQHAGGDDFEAAALAGNARAERGTETRSLQLLVPDRLRTALQRSGLVLRGGRRWRSGRLEMQHALLHAGIGIDLERQRVGPIDMQALWNAHDSGRAVGRALLP